MVFCAVTRLLCAAGSPPSSLCDTSPAGEGYFNRHLSFRLRFFTAPENDSADVVPLLATSAVRGRGFAASLG